MSTKTIEASTCKLKPMLFLSHNGIKKKIIKVLVLHGTEGKIGAEGWYPLLGLELVAFNGKADEAISSGCSNKKEKNTVLSNSVDMGSLKSRDKKSVNEKRSHWR